MSYLFSFSRYQTKCVIKIYLRSSSKAMADREKEGKTEIQKFEHLENERSFLDKIKSTFHNNLSAIIW